MSTDLHNNMTVRSVSVFADLGRLALPLCIAQLASIGIMTADVVMMGQLSTLDLAAGSLAVRLYQPFYFFSLGLLSVISALVAQSIGADQPDTARRVFRQGLILSSGLGAVFMMPVLAGEQLMLFFGQSEDIAGRAADYLFWSAFGLPASLVFLTMRFFTMGHGRAGPQLLATFAGLAFNMVANPVLAYGYGLLPALGLGGIALATTLTYFVMCFCLGLIIKVDAPFAQTKPYQRWWVIDLSLMKKIIQVGWPNGFLVMSETGMFVVAAFIIGLFGAAPLAAAGIANQIAAMAFMIPLSVAQACVIRVGRSAGAVHLAGVKQYGNGGIWLGCLIVIPLTCGIWLFAEQLGFLFIQPDDKLSAQTIALIIPMLWITALFQLGDSLQAIITASLRGLNDTRMPALYGFICFWIISLGSGVVMAFWLGWGPVAVWAGLGLGLTLNAAILALRWWRRLHAVEAGKISLLEVSVKSQTERQ
ncbi:putative efflux protein, MATE family [SAR116 cluster alpha proteobacterium HIMB100]|nr:putative efflux protein, MATE family [SAR116 cluster alpha proteobacterium HIMB100]